MDGTSNFLIPFIFLIFSAIFLLHRWRRKGLLNNGQFPPGPPGWPIIGNLLDVGTLPHRTLNDMKQKYGDVIGLKLGAINTMVILSPKAALEFFKNHDVTFADRTIIQAMRICDFNQGALSLIPYGSHWRVLRKLVMVDMLGTKKLNETAFLRRKCMDDMLRWISEEISSGRANSGIKIAHLVFLMAFNLMGNLIFSRNVLDPESRECSELMRGVLTLMELSVQIDLVDFFPWLKWIMNINGGVVRKEMDRKVGEVFDLALVILKERIEEKKKNLIGNRSKDFLDVLIEFEGNGKDEPEKISEHNMMVFILEMFTAVAENMSSTTEWALTELLRNTDEIKKAKSELASVIGPNRKVEETDIDNLPYLQAITKETLRLHTPVPLLVPRKATQDTKFMGFHIPQNTQVFVNVWAIARDPEMWEDAACFKPQRFLESNVDYKGQHFEFLPFGGGRRICVGLNLSHRVMNLLLGSLLHEFDWELGPNIDPDNMDMREIVGLTMRKLEPLLVVPKKTTNA